MPLAPPATSCPFMSHVKIVAIYAPKMSKWLLNQRVCSFLESLDPSQIRSQILINPFWALDGIGTSAFCPFMPTLLQFYRNVPNIFAHAPQFTHFTYCSNKECALYSSICLDYHFRLTQALDPKGISRISLAHLASES